MDKGATYLGAITDKAHNKFWGQIMREDTRTYKMQKEMEQMSKRRNNQELQQFLKE